MTSHNEIRLHQEVDLKQYCRDSDAAIQAAMDTASRKAPEGLAPEILKNAGFAYGQELYEAQAVLEKLDPASPARNLTKQQQLALTSCGISWLAVLVEETEKHLSEGRPASSITRTWAEAKVKTIRNEAAAERKRHAVAQPTSAQIISKLKNEKEAVEAKASTLEAELEKAREIIALLQGTNS